MSKKEKPKTDQQQSMTSPWISMRTGLRVVALASIGMAVLTAWQVIPSMGWGKGILWGLIFGAMLWAVFGLMQLFYRFMR